MSKTVHNVLAALLLMAVAAGLAYYFLYVRGAEKGPQPVRTTGIVEAVEINIAPKIAGKLVYVGFREGDRVTAGELVAELDQDELEAAHRQAEAALRAAEAALESGRDGVEAARADVEVARAEKTASEAAVAGAGARLDQANKDLARARELYDKGIIPSSEMDRAQSEKDTLLAALDEAKAKAELAGSSVAAAKAALSRSVSAVEELKARAVEAGRGVELAAARLADAKMLSPADAVVEYRTLEPGEVVSPGMSVLTLLDLSTLWVRIDLEQRYAGQVKVNDEAEITLENMPDKAFRGEVFDIGVLGRFATERDVTRGRQDIKSFRTRIRVTDPEGILKPGMTVLVKIPIK